MTLISIPQIKFETSKYCLKSAVYEDKLKHLVRLFTTLHSHYLSRVDHGINKYVMTNLALSETDKSMQQLRHIDLGFDLVLNTFNATI